MNIDLLTLINIYIALIAGTLFIGTFKRFSFISWLMSIIAPGILLYSSLENVDLLIDLQLSYSQRGLILVLTIITLVLNVLGYSDKLKNISKLVVHMVMLLASCAVISSKEMILFIVSIELLVICIYTLILTSKSEKNPIYIIRAYLQSTLITIVTTLGISFYLLATKSLSFDNINVENQELFVISISIFTLVTLMRLLVYPLHSWLSQALPIINFKDTLSIMCLSVAPIAISNLILLNNLINVLDYQYQESLIVFIKLISLVSCFITALLALKASNIHTKIGYISLSQMPLILLSLGNIQSSEIEKHIIGYVFVLIFSYAFSTMLLLTVKTKDFSSLKTDDLLGLYKLDISKTVLITISICSIIGLPFTVGFIVKLDVIKELIRSGEVYTVIVYLISFSISTYCALNILLKMFTSKEKHLYNIEIIGNNFRVKMLKYLIALSVIIGGVIPALI